VHVRDGIVNVVKLQKEPVNDWETDQFKNMMRTLPVFSMRLENMVIESALLPRGGFGGGTGPPVGDVGGLVTVSAGGGGSGGGSDDSGGDGGSGTDGRLSLGKWGENKVSIFWATFSICNVRGCCRARQRHGTFTRTLNKNAIEGCS
jgi:hypothetical protein